MFGRSLSKVPIETIASRCEVYMGRGTSHQYGVTPQLSRGFTAPAESLDAVEERELVIGVNLRPKPTWAPGMPPPGRKQTIKLNALHSLLKDINTRDELKYAHLGLQLFKTKDIRITEKTATLYIQACCRTGTPQAAVEMLSKSEMGLTKPGLVTANRFNFLLTQLYRAGDPEGLKRALNQALDRGQVMDKRSHAVIAKIEAAEKARELAKAEEERIAAERAAAEKAAVERVGDDCQSKEHAAESKDMTSDTRREAVVSPGADHESASGDGHASSPGGVITEGSVAGDSEEAIGVGKAADGSGSSESR